MQYLIGGRNRYRTEQIRRSCINRWRAKHPDGEVITIDVDDVQHPQELSNKLTGASLFSAQSLYVLKRVQKSQNDVQNAFLQAMNSYTLDFIIWEDAPLDKRRKLYKTIRKQGLVEEHNELNTYQLRSWIQQQLEKREVTYDNKIIDLLQLRLGDDQFRLSHAITVLVNYARATQGVISPEAVDLLVPSTLEEDIWSILDALGDNGKKDTLKRVDHYITDAGMYASFIGLIARQLRLLTQIKTSGNNINGLRIHPYVLKKMRTQSKRFSIEYLKILYKKLIDTDMAVKTGFMDYKLAIELYLTLF